MSCRLALVLGLVVLAAAAATGAVAAPSITASARPDTPLFGDPFTYLVVVKTPAVDAGRVRIVDDVGAFARVAPTRTIRSVSNGVATTTVTETLACLTAACMSSSPDGRSVTLPRARAVLDGATTTAIPVIVRVGTRVPASEVTANEPPFRRPHDLPRSATGCRRGRSRRRSSPAGWPFSVQRCSGSRCRSCDDGESMRKRLPPPTRLRARSGSCASRSTATRPTAAVPRRSPPALSTGRELSLEAAAVAWSRPEPGPPDATMLADRVEREEAPA